jgi:hypothetical protein
VGKWRGPASGRIVLRGQGGSGAYRRAFEVAAGQAAQGEALRYRWARRRIAETGDDYSLDRDPARAAEITRLGLAYNLLTEFTSFVAVDTRVRGDGRPAETVQQPLPLPEGVSDHAVGGMRVKAQVAAPVPVAYAAPGALAGTTVADGKSEMDGGGAVTAVRTREVERRSGNEARNRHASDETGCLETEVRTWSFPAAREETTLTVRLSVSAGRAIIERLESSGALGTTALRPVVTAGLAALGRCLGDGTVRLKIVVNAAGAVTGVEVLP